MTSIPRTLPLVLIAAIALVLSFSGGAVAGKLITGKQIKDNTVSTKDIKNGSLQSLDLSASTIAELQRAGDLVRRSRQAVHPPGRRPRP